MIIILPNDRVDISWPSFSLFFLAGPVLGGGDWQYKMCQHLETETRRPQGRVYGGLYVAIPCRYPLSHPLRQMQCEGTPKGAPFSQQLDWERYYLDYAPCTRNGRIIFWLACESKTEPRNDGNPYARDTYGELGEWRGRMMSDTSLKSRVFIGAEEGFPGLDQIRRNFKAALGVDFRIYSTMQEVARAACR